MLTTIEAEIETDGSVRLLEPLQIKKKSRVIVTILDDEDRNGDEQPRRNESVRELFGSAGNGYSIKKPETTEEGRLAEERFARHIGAVSSGDPNSADNEKIDADLAREYGATHDDE